MDNYLRLSNAADKDGLVDFVANKTKNNYINLKGINRREVIDCLHKFLCKYGIWDSTDKVIHTKKAHNYVPDPNSFHDISFVVKFYDMACKSKETKERMQEPEVTENLNNFVITQDSHSLVEEVVGNPQQVIVKTLTNPNIDHSKQIDNSQQKIMDALDKSSDKNKSQEQSKSQEQLKLQEQSKSHEQIRNLEQSKEHKKTVLNKLLYDDDGLDDIIEVLDSDEERKKNNSNKNKNKKNHSKENKSKEHKLKESRPNEIKSKEFKRKKVETESDNDNSDIDTDEDDMDSDALDEAISEKNMEEASDFEDGSTDDESPEESDDDISEENFDDVDSDVASESNESDGDDTDESIEVILKGKKPLASKNTRQKKKSKQKVQKNLLRSLFLKKVLSQYKRQYRKKHKKNRLLNLILDEDQTKNKLQIKNKLQ